MIVLVETWLDDDEKLELQGYEPFRNNRNSNGGGVMIAVKEELATVTKKQIETKGTLESLWVTINNGRHKVKIGAAYIPKEQIGKEELQEAFNKLSDEAERGIIAGYQTLVIGDTNAKIEEEGDSIGGRIQKEMLRKLNMTILNDTDRCEGKWTRIQNNCKSRLDYVIACESAQDSLQWMTIDEPKLWTPLRIKKEKGLIKQVYTDHTAILMEFNWMIGECAKLKEIRKQYGPKENSKFRELLGDTPFQKILGDTELDFNERYNTWSKMVVQAYEKAGKEVKQRKNRTKEERLLQNKYKELRRHQRQKGEDLREEINNIREEILAAEGRQINRRAINVVQHMKKAGGSIDSARFWEVHKKLSNRRKEPEAVAIKDKEGVRVDEHGKVRDVYKEFYTKLLTPQQSRTEQEKNRERRIATHLDSILGEAQTQDPMEISKEIVRNNIRKLKRKKAPDRDHWKNEMLLDGGSAMEAQVQTILTHVAKEESIPTAWEEVRIKSIHKKGSTLEMNNRRGVFVTNIISKLWEKIILQKLQESLEIDIHQNGGQKGKGTLDNLMAILTVQQRAKKANQEVFMIFADAYKCFDRLWLKDCLIDLKGAGAKEKEITYIYNLNKKSRVVVDTPAGLTEEIELGEIVKQGTVLGPQLCCTSTQKINQMGPPIVNVLSPELYQYT